MNLVPIYMKSMKHSSSKFDRWLAKAHHLSNLLDSFLEFNINGHSMQILYIYILAVFGWYFFVEYF